MYSIAGGIFIKVTPERSFIFNVYTQNAFLMQFFLFVYAYLELKANKMNFLTRRKVIKLVDE